MNPERRDRQRQPPTVKLGSFKIAPQTLTVLPYSTGEITITPNSAIPADGYANVTLRSPQPVVARW